MRSFPIQTPAAFMPFGLSVARVALCPSGTTLESSHEQECCPTNGIAASVLPGRSLFTPTTISIHTVAFISVEPIAASLISHTRAAGLHHWTGPTLEGCPPGVFNTS